MTRLAAGIFLGLSCLLLSACGYHLQNPQFKSLPKIQLQSEHPNNPLAKILRQQLKPVTSNTATNEVITLVILNEQQQQRFSNTTTIAQAKLYHLIYTISYQIIDQQGKIYSEPKTLSTERYWLVQVNNMLAAKHEKDTILAEMRQVLSQQLITRLKKLLQ